MQTGEGHAGQAWRGSNTFGDTKLQDSINLQGTFGNVQITEANVGQPLDFTGVFSSTFTRPVTNYVHRPVLQEKLQRQLHEAVVAETACSPFVVLHGLGGSGKSQLLRQYFQQHRDDYAAGFWIAAESRSSIDTDFRQIHRCLFSARTSTDSQEPIADVIAAVKSWFSRYKKTYFIVFDGADLIEENDPAYSLDLERYLPNTYNVHIAVSTRSAQSQMWASGEAIEVGELSTTEASDLFKSCVKRSLVDQESDVRDIVEELGNLALAVNLAGCYIQQTPLLAKNLKDYLPEYRNRRKILLQQKPTKAAQYGANVLTTWDISFEAIRRRNEGACRFLTLLAFLSPKDIYVDLFCGEKKNLSSPITSSWANVVLPGKEIDLLTIQEFFSVISEFSFVQFTITTEGYSMHTLVHAWGFERLEVNDLRTYGAAALELIATSIKKTGEALETRERLIAHVEAVLSALKVTHEGADFGDENPLWQLGLTRNFSFEMGRYPTAETAGRLCLDVSRQHNGNDHAETRSAMICLASALQYERKLGEAASLQTAVLETRMRILRVNHPATLSVMNDLGSTLRDQGKLDEAESMHRTVLREKKEAPGDNRLDTLKALHNLARTLRDQGKWKEAASMQKEVLETRKSILGDDDPATLYAMADVAVTLQDQGKLKDAASMFRTVLGKMRPVLGDSHPETLRTMSNLATNIDGNGQTAEAASIRTTVLEKKKATRGDNHPDTLSALSSLANSLRKQKRPKEAESMYVQALGGKERVFGLDHSSTLETVLNLGLLYKAQGELVKAKEMFERALDGRKKTLGPKHSMTLDTYLCFGVLYLDQGKREEAEEMFKRATPGSNEETLRRNPRSAIITINALGNLYMDQKNLVEAEKTLMRGMTLVKEVAYEVEDPPAILTADNLGHVYWSQGKLGDAERMLMRVLHGCEKAYGAEHFGSRSAVRSLANLHNNRDQLPEAETMYRRALEDHGKALGAEDASTRQIADQLTFVYIRKGDSLKALETQKQLGEGIFERLVKFASSDKSAEFFQFLFKDTYQTEVVSGEGYTALHTAARYGSLRVAGLFLEHGANVNARTLHQSTPLTLAAEFAHAAVVDLLLADPHIDVNACDLDGDTALIVAAAGGHLSIVRSLLQSERLQKGLTNKQGLTALAAAQEERHEEIATLLQ